MADLAASLPEPGALKAVAEALLPPAEAGYTGRKEESEGPCAHLPSQLPL